MFYGPMLGKSSNQQNIEWQDKVEGGRRESRQRPSPFSCCQKKGDKKKLRVVAVTQVDTLNFFLTPEETWQKQLRVVAVTQGDNPQGVIIMSFPNHDP